MGIKINSLDSGICSPFEDGEEVAFDSYVHAFESFYKRFNGHHLWNLKDAPTVEEVLKNFLKILYDFTPLLVIMQPRVIYRFVGTWFDAVNI